MKTIIFDLDGTLVNSGEGIIKCAQEVFAGFGMDVPSYDTLRCFVGPPLYVSFERFGIPEDKMDQAIKAYRTRYNTVGLFESFVYSGIDELLAKLKRDGFRLFVATAKPERIAQIMLKHYGLDTYFECICGALENKTRREKKEVIAHLLETYPDMDNIVMVGDTMTDIEGALCHGIPTIAVLWGYGSREQLLQNAAHTAETVDGLYKLCHECDCKKIVL